MNNTSDAEFEMVDLFRLFWQFKWVNIAISLAVILVCFVLSNRLPNIYRSEALLVPIDESEGAGMASFTGKIGNLASLAGVDLVKNQSRKSDVAIEILRSRKFLADFVSRHGILVPLIAGGRWDTKSKKLELDSSIYDEVNNNWIGEYKNSNYRAPTPMQAYEALSSRLSITKSKDTGLVRVSFDFLSPVLAKEWVDLLVKDINKHVKDSDIEEASKSIKYMQQQLESTPLSEMKQVFYQVIERQVQTIMLASAREEYVFKTVDPAFVPEKKVSPNRLMLMVLAAFCVQVVFITVLLAMCMRSKDS